ncbi:MAG: AzlD domain-containing protein [Haloplanus sp.]
MTPATTNWLLVVVLGVGTFALRLSFIQLYGRLGAFPRGVTRALGFVPAAILAALVFPALFPLGGSVADTLVGPHAVAGGVAALVAWRTRSMTATIVVGMAVLWGLQGPF